MIVVWKLSEFETRYRFLEKVTLNPVPHTLNDASQQLPGGVYTTFRTYTRRRVPALQEHFQRLEESARLSGRRITLDRQAVREALRRCVVEFTDPEARVRLTLDLEKEPGSLYISLATLRIPTPEEYEAGVAADLCRLNRNNPKAKQTAFIPAQEKAQRSLPPGAYEGLIVDDNERIMEGLSSNFFAVKEGTLYTAESGVLSGIARATVLKVAQRLGIRTRLEPVSVGEVDRLEETFITSSSRGVLPVRQIGKTIIGTGLPGPITKQLAEGFIKEINSRLEEL